MPQFQATKLIHAGLDGHVLVFLPGASKIRRAQEVIADFAQRQQLELHVLHGDLPSSEQDRALRPSSKRKIILSTNVAETSVTIDGIAAVVESGLARIAAHSPWSGLPTLKVAKISKAAAIQRAGRAGRTRAGTCVRLYTRGDFEGRAGAEIPEIRRMDFTESALALRALGVTEPASFPFFEAPQPSSLDAAEILLRRLGAITATGELTPIGRRLLRFPLHPRQARLLVEAENLGVAREGATLAALLGERDIRLETRARFAPGGPSGGTSGPSDLLELLERFERGQKGGARSAGLDAQAMSTVERALKQLSRQLDTTRAPSPRGLAEHESALLRAVLAGYPDRVARRRRPKAPELVLSQGGSATIDATSVVHDAELMVAVDAEERRGGVFVRLASRIDAEWLLEVAPDELGEVDALEWNEGASRVERITRLTYGALTLEETRQPAPPSEGATKLLAQHALDAGVGRFAGEEKLAAWRCRVDTVRKGFPLAGFPSPDDAFVEAALAQSCEGLRSFAELEAMSLLDVLQAKLTPAQAAQLARETPERITLPGGRAVRINYEPAKPPWIESRLQDFFGMVKGPAIGSYLLVLHLLASLVSNHRRHRTCISQPLRQCRLWHADLLRQRRRGLDRRSQHPLHHLLLESFCIRHGFHPLLAPLGGQLGRSAEATTTLTQGGGQHALAGQHGAVGQLTEGGPHGERRERHHRRPRQHLAQEPTVLSVGDHRYSWRSGNDPRETRADDLGDRGEARGLVRTV